MNKFFQVAASLIVSSVCAWHLSGNAAENASNFWKVSNEKHTLYILGVTHVGDQRQYPLGAPILDAFNQSSIYITESRLAYEPLENVKDVLRREYTAESGKTLRALLATPACMEVEGSATLTSSIQAALPSDLGTKVLGLSPRATIHQIANPAVDNRQLSMKSLQPAMAVESSLRLQARKQGIALGTLDDEYWRGIDQLGPKQTCELLLTLVRFHARSDRDQLAVSNYTKVLAALLNHDSAGTLAAYLEQYEAPGQNDDSSALRVWMKNRNTNMARILEETSNRIGFVAIGAAHLPGKNGVISILGRHGYKTEPINLP